MILAILGTSLTFSCDGWCQAQAILSPKEEKPAAAVEVEVKKSEGKQPAEVRVRVQGKEVEPKAADKKAQGPQKILPHPEERLAPIATEKIDKAGKEVGKKLDELAEKSSYRLGDWIEAKAFNGITWLKLIASLALFLLVLVFERGLSYLIKRRLRRIETEARAPTWPEVLLEALCKPLCLFIWVYGTYAAISPLFVHFEKPFGENVFRHLASKAADIGGLLAVIWFIYRVVRLVDIELRERAKSPESRIEELEASLVGKTLRWTIVFVGGVLILQYVTGIQAGPLIASLGLGGLAIALAAKESIANLFGTVTIAFDKPFKVGDRVKVDSFDGFVESVGYRSTRIRLWNGNLVNLPNQKIISSSTENFARRRHIWWRTDITITYDTPPDKVDRAVEIIQDILEEDEETSKERPPWVFFDGFNEWSLNIRVLAWFQPDGRVPEQFDYFTWRQRSCRMILRRFAEEGIQFAFPTRTTHLANDDKRQLKLMTLQQEHFDDGVAADFARGASWNG
jgi:MscS family membrane protein